MNLKTLSATALLLSAVACSQEQASQTQEASGRVADAAQAEGQQIQERLDPAVPVGPPPTAQELEQERFNQEWRRLGSFQVSQPSPTPVAPQMTPAQMTPVPIAASPTPAAPAQDIAFVQDPRFGEKMAGTNPAVIDTMPVRVPVKGDVNGPTVLKAQILLDRARFSPGFIDGRWGKNSEIAVYWFQRENGLPPTGEIDEGTYRALAAAGGNQPALLPYVLTAEDVKGPFTPIPEDVYDQEKLKCLCYETLTEALAERFHTSAGLLQTLNPGMKMDTAAAGQQIMVPNVRQAITQDTPAALSKLVVSVKGSYIHAVDMSGRTVFHAPTTLGSKYDPSPNETVKIVGIAHNPHFHYQPKLFHEVPDTNPEANLQPGPNSPVGVVWVALSKKHFGIHGTAHPESIGYSSSHGCVRLSNWDANDLSRQVQKGLTVEFVDTRAETAEGTPATAASTPTR